MRWLVACALIACSDLSRVATSRANIIGGSNASDAAVVAIHVRRTQCNDTVSQPLCSGTLIAKRVVLTAAHCVEPEASGVGYEVAFGDLASDPAAARQVVIAVERHPQFVKATYAFDVALLLLGEEATVEPIALSTTPPVPVIGDRVRAVGFGVEERAGTPGRKNAGTMKVRSVADDAFESVPDPGMSCVGDSGGPVFLEQAGVTTLIGVTSSGDVACREFARNYRIDSVRAFIDAFVARANAMPPGPPMASISPESFCSVSCSKSADCAGGLPCRDGRCVLPGTVPGNFSRRCGPKEACGAGETCARFWPSGDFACLCHKPCEGGPTLPPPVDGGPPIAPNGDDSAQGCACSWQARSPDGSALVTLVTLLTLVTLKARRRRSTGRSPARRAESLLRSAK